MLALTDDYEITLPDDEIFFEYIDPKKVAAIPAADVVPGSDFRDCRNELCLRCGQYKTAHLGSCDGCRWRH